MMGAAILFQPDIDRHLMLMMMKTCLNQIGMIYLRSPSIGI